MSSGLHQVAKALLLFIFGCKAKYYLLSDEYPFYVHYGYYLILTSFAFNYAMSFKNEKLKANDFSVVIAGAGASGIAMAIKLKELGIKFRIIEKEQNLAGTWWLNRYPGCECDVPSHIYSYSFYLNPNWSRSYSSQSEIFRYFEDMTEKFNIKQYIEFGKKVTSSQWDEETQKWTVELGNGEKITCNALVSAVGALHVPKVPDFLGADSFKGDAFHSAEWPYNYDPKGKRVAVIGTGASAVQIVPSIAEKVSQLTVFQRTPCWVPPKDAIRYPSWLKALFTAFPPLMYLLRCFYFWRAEMIFMGIFRNEGFLRKRSMRLIKGYYKKVVKDPAVREKLIPKFEMGCKRVTPSNHYLQSYNLNNVTLETSKIKCIVENGIQTEDGTIHEVDTIIYATGFDLMKNISSVKMFGRREKKSDKQENGLKSLEDKWGDNPNAFKGITYPGFPNVFFLLGPGTGLGHNSILFMIECQITYVLEAMKSMVNDNIKSIECKKEVNDRYQSWVMRTMQNKIFLSETCVSYYKNAAGVAFALWPSHLTNYWWNTRKLDLDDYICVR